MDKEVLKVDVSVTDTDIFQQVLGTVEDMLNDERIDKKLRDEYSNRFKKALKQLPRNLVLK